MLFVLCFIFNACSSQTSVQSHPENSNNGELKEDSIKKSLPLPVLTGADQTNLYINLLKGKNIAVVSNQTSNIQKTHLVDSLLSLGVKIQRVFSPEHGFRGNHDAGAHVNHEIDQKTGIPIFSLHGKTKKPTKQSLEGIDWIVFDIQDVGVRFYTYISTLHYVMEAAAENDIPIIVLDRPNPNAHYMDGPVLDSNYKSFVGMHPVPVVYGMTIGEYAQMINGERWLNDSLMANLTVVPLRNWDHEKPYKLPVAPSPNLPNQLSIYLYPSLCFFEGTEVSIGRGTPYPFQVWGHPNAKCESIDHFSFTPVSMPGKSKYPKHENKTCFGKDFRNHSVEEIRKEKQLSIWIIKEAFKCVGPEKSFFNRPDFFNLLAGNNTFIQQLKNHIPEEEIRLSWKDDLKKFQEIRQKYLLYK